MGRWMPSRLVGRSGRPVLITRHPNRPPLLLAQAPSCPLYTPRSPPQDSVVTLALLPLQPVLAHLCTVPAAGASVPPKRKRRIPVARRHAHQREVSHLPGTRIACAHIVCPWHAHVHVTSHTRAHHARCGIARVRRVRRGERLLARHPRARCVPQSSALRGVPSGDHAQIALFVTVQLYWIGFYLLLTYLRTPTHLLTYSPTHLLTYSPTHLLIHLPTSPTYLPTPPTYLSHLPTHPPTYSPTYLLTYYSPTYLFRAALLDWAVRGALSMDLGHQPLHWEPVHELDYRSDFDFRREQRRAL